jgi:hypothetical protein
MLWVVLMPLTASSGQALAPDAGFVEICSDGGLKRVQLADFNGESEGTSQPESVTPSRPRSRSGAKAKCPLCPPASDDQPFALLPSVSVWLPLGVGGGLPQPEAVSFSPPVPRIAQARAPPLPSRREVA